MDAKCSTLHLQFLLIFLFFVSSTQPTFAATTTTFTTTTNKAYVKKVCNTTTFPKICYDSLSLYASTIKSNPKKLCITALNVTHQVARKASALIASTLNTKGLNFAEISVIKVCEEEMVDSIYQLKKSLKAAKEIGGPDDLEYQIADIRTWVSAALTDVYTCTDEIDDNKKIRSSLKSKIKSIVLNLLRATTIDLALINTLQY